MWSGKMYCYQNELFYSLKYYGNADAGTYFELNKILGDVDGVRQWLNQINSFSIECIEDYITFLEIDKLSLFAEMSESIKDSEIRRKFEDVCWLAEEKKKSFRNKDLVSFLNSNMSQLFGRNREYHGLSDVTISLCAKFQEGISDQAFEYLIAEQSHLVIDNYKLFQKKIEGNELLFQKLFSVGSIEKLLQFRLDEVFAILSPYCHEKSKYREKVIDAVNYIINFGEEEISSATADNIIRKDHIIRAILAFLQTIKHPKANDFNELRLKTDKLLGEHLSQNGNVHQFQIPTDDIKSMLESDEITWPTKLVLITHSVDKSSGKLKNNLDFKPQNKHPIIDMARSNIPTNDYFSFSHQQVLRTTKIVGGIAIMMMLEDEKGFQGGTTAVSGEIATIEKRITHKENELLDDFELLTQMLFNVFRCSQSEEIVNQSLCYGAATFIAAYIEKLLRLCFVEQTRSKIYVPEKNITLGTLLRGEVNKQISQVLGEYQTNHLRYFLLNDDPGNVGCNYRNRLAHWNQIKPASLTKHFVAQMFYLLLSVINSMFLFYKSTEGVTDSENT